MPPEVIEVGTTKSSWLGRTLSNFAYSPFKFMGCGFCTTEGFWQGLKWSECMDERYECFGTLGWAAKELGGQAPKKLTQFRFRDEMYQVGSPQHLNLMKGAIRAKIEQNERLLREFLASGDAKFTHPIPERRDTVLPREVFCQMLWDIREELRGGQEEE